MKVGIEEAVAESADKWEIQLRKGCLELAILAALWPAPLYGLEIMRLLANESGLVVPEGTVYPLLNRLKSEGMLSSEWVETAGGHPRKYYTLTTDGRRRAVRMTRFWTDFAASLGALLLPLQKEEL